MFTFWATIKKDFRMLARDKVGLTFMFAMPILLVVVITSIQNSTFELVNNNKIHLLICNRDTGELSKQLELGIEKIGMFEIYRLPATQNDQQIIDRMHAKDALVAVIIPGTYSVSIQEKAQNVTNRAMKDFGLKDDSSTGKSRDENSITLYYHPVLQQSFRSSIDGALRSALQLVESRTIVKSLYFSINEKQVPDSVQNAVEGGQIPITEIPVSRDGTRNIPNATQHNVPAWTIFAMFFVVISLGGSIVREKNDGSFLRLKTLPTGFWLAIVSKQTTYLIFTLVQAAVIFSIGLLLFPLIGLPALNLPADKIGLFIVTIVCGWCAVSYAICIGIFAQTQEQANGFGAVSVIILAAIGGILVPSFAMPDSFKLVMRASPMHWGLEAYYGLFLEGGKLKDILVNILSLLGITAIIQFASFLGLKRKNLI